jgi:CubicO group peptidase (beta-lactamase class C family)
MNINGIRDKMAAHGAGFSMTNLSKISLILLSLLLFSCSDKSIRSSFEQYEWEFSTPDEQGLDPEILDSAFTRAEQLGFVDALVVIRNSCILAEEYYNDYNSEMPHNVMSVSKSFLSALTGLALEHGFLENLEEHMLDYFPEYIHDDIDPRKFAITVRHLLTMRMGIAHDQVCYLQIYNSQNWIKTTIEYPLASDPGERFSYNTFQTHLLAAIIARSSGTSVSEFAEKYLTSAMGIDIDFWERDLQGNFFGGNNMYFTPREMAVLGYMYLNNGRIDGTQIIPEDWVALTLSPSTDLGPNSWGVLKNYNYAHLWWLGQLNDHDVFMAIGHGGQFIINIPFLNMIVVTTADNDVDWDNADEQETAVLSIISKYVLPAVNR